MTAQETLKELQEYVTADESLDSEIKESLLPLINKVIEDPQSDDLEALKIVLGQLSDSERYLGILQGMTDEVMD